MSAPTVNGRLAVNAGGGDEEGDVQISAVWVTVEVLNSGNNELRAPTVYTNLGDFLQPGQVYGIALGAYGIDDTSELLAIATDNPDFQVNITNVTITPSNGDTPGFIVAAVELVPGTTTDGGYVIIVKTGNNRLAVADVTPVGA